MAVLSVDGLIWLNRGIFKMANNNSKKVTAVVPEYKESMERKRMRVLHYISASEQLVTK